MPTDTFLNLAEDKQQRVLQAAIKEFGERSLQEANLSNIIKDAGISRGSLYQYFKTKEDLYIYIFATLRAERAEYVKPAFVLYKNQPFLRFFEEFYLRDSEYLLRHPAHIELGKKLYSSNDTVSRGLIQQLQIRYRDWFLVGIEYDKEQHLIDSRISSTALADLCVHLVTDIFIFQSAHTRLTIANISEHNEETLYIIKNGIGVRPVVTVPE